MKPAGQVGAVDRVGEEEAQGRNDAVDGGDAQACLALFDLELPQILDSRGIGRTAQISGKPSDMAHVVELGLAGEPAHVHFFDHALPQRVDGGIRQSVGHRTTPWLKGATIVCLPGADLNFIQAADQRAYLKASTAPAPAGSYLSHKQAFVT